MEMSTNGGANTLVADKLLLATGRVSNADRLQVKNSGVEVDGRGFESTNEYLETNVPGVWALGDIVGRYLLKHSANLEAAYGASILDLNGFVEVLADPNSRQILGCHIIGTHAAMLIQAVANAMRMHLTTDAITQSIYVHPTLPEVVQRAFGELGV